MLSKIYSIEETLKGKDTTDSTIVSIDLTIGYGIRKTDRINYSQDRLDRLKLLAKE